MTLEIEREDTATVLTPVSDVDDPDALVDAIDATEADPLDLEDGFLELLVTLSFEFETPDGERLNDDSFFEHACTFDRGRERTAAFLETFIERLDGASESGTYLWRDNESPTPLWGAYQLALSAERYVPLYARFIEHTDMDHEVHQREQIDGLIDEHGWTAGTETLLAVRATTATGQYGLEQLGSHAAFVREHADSPLYESSLFDAFISHYHTGPGIGWDTLAEMHGDALLDEDEQDAWLARVDRELAG